MGQRLSRSRTKGKKQILTDITADLNKGDIAEACPKLEKETVEDTDDVSQACTNLETETLEDTDDMSQACTNLETETLEDTDDMSQACTNLETETLEDTDDMSQACTNLETETLEDTNDMAQACPKLEKETLKDTDDMAQACTNLETETLEDTDDMAQPFTSLRTETLKKTDDMAQPFTNLRTETLENTDDMAKPCTKLEKLTVKDADDMAQACSNFEKQTMEDTDVVPRHIRLTAADNGGGHSHLLSLSTQSHRVSKCVITTSCQAGTQTQDINILLIGRIGQGKSATGNSILRNRNFETSNHSLSATTKHVQWSSGEHTTKEGRRYKMTVADGPGLQDKELSNAQDKRRTYQNIAKVLQESGSGIHAFIFVIRWGDHFTEEESEAVNYLKRVLGQQFLMNHGVVAVTHGDSFKGKEYNFQQWCKQLSYNFKEIFEEYGRFEAFGLFGECRLFEECGLFKECRYRCVLFNNNTENEKLKTDQMDTLFETLEGMWQHNKGRPYTTQEFQKLAEEHDKLRIEFGFTAVREEFRRHLNNVWNKIRHITDINSVNRSISAFEALLKQVQFENEETSISERLQKDLEGLGDLLMEMKQEDPETGLFQRHSAEAETKIQKIVYRASYKTDSKKKVFDLDFDLRYY